MFFQSSERRSVPTVCRLLCCVSRVNCDTVNLLGFDSAVDQPLQEPHDVASSLLVTSRRAPRPKQATRQTDRQKEKTLQLFLLHCFCPHCEVCLFFFNAFYNSVVQ